MSGNKNYPMKDENKKKKEGSASKSEEIDYESLYYKAMKENVLLKDNRISIEFNSVEIDLMRGIMYEELKDVISDMYLNDDIASDEEENRLLQNAMLKSIMDEKIQTVENILKKLRFEL